MFVADLDAAVCGHLAVAVHSYRERMAADDKWTPPALAELEAVWVQSARNRQEPTISCQPADVVHSDLVPMLLTNAQVAELLQVSERTVERLEADGILKVVKVGRATRVRRTDLDHYVESLEAA